MTFKKLTVAIAVSCFVAPALAAQTTSISKIQKQITQLQAQVQQLKAERAQHGATASAKQNMAYRAVSVTTTPLLARQSLADGSDLTSNFSAINEDLKLLQMRQQETAAMIQSGMPMPTTQRPSIQLSGYLNADFEYDSPATYGASNHSTSLDITAAELDTTAFVSPWVNAFVALKWNTMSVANGGANNVVSANRAFITLGKLSSSPFYGSFGNMYVPFGRYSTALITDPNTKQAARTLANHGALLVGYAAHNISAQAFTYKSNMTVTGKTTFSYGADANYYGHFKNADAQLGAGVISNAADSLGMQAALGTSTALKTKVPAFDLNGQASYGPVQVTSEFVMPTSAFNTSDLSFTPVGKTKEGAKPKTFHIEGLYNFTAMNRPSNVGLFFDHSWQALALGLPEKGFGAIFNTEIKKDLDFALQYSHNIDYKKGDVATAHATTTTGTGKSQNVFYAQLAVYF